MDTAQEMPVNTPKRPQGTPPGKSIHTPRTVNRMVRTATRASSTRAPQTSLAS